jgi:NAD(P)H-hydrate epimerase
MAAPDRPVAVLCGPGNNGGDGFVAARLLAARGYEVRLYQLGGAAALKGDAQAMAQRWMGDVAPISDLDLAGCGLAVDALFGAGLARPLDGFAAAAVETVNASGVPILAVDVPSGLDGTTGLAGGPVVKAARTVTFFRKKPGHVLLPGRGLCGEVVVADIGIPATVLADICARASENGPAAWQASLPRPALDAHKYARGHAIVVSGPAESTGAARLGARGALRAGAGLVTVASPRAAFPVNAAHLTAIMVKAFTVPEGLADVLADKRRNALLIGPGCGVGEDTRRMIEIALASEAACVLDADALTSFAEPVGKQEAGFGFLAPRAALASAGDLMEAVRGRAAAVVMTPHEGEFARLFGAIGGSKLERARAAAARSGAIVVLKGADTVIAGPDGRAAVNTNAPPWLATAGSGDVLAGIITGLLAQRMPAFEAACAAVWMHGACASAFGPGLIAEDLPEALPGVLVRLLATAGSFPIA